MGRFINADDIGYLGAGNNLTSYNLFAYCGNNSVNSIDPTGTIAWALLPWHIIIPTFVGGGIGFISSLLSGESITQSIFDGFIGASTAALIAAYPSAAIIFTSAEYMLLLSDCLYQGLGFEESMVRIGLTTVSNIGFPSSGDALTDMAVESTFGSVKSLFCTVIEEVAITDNSTSPNPQAVTSGIYAMLAVGSSGGGNVGMTNICFDAVGGQSLCYRP